MPVARQKIIVIGPHPPIRGGIADTNRELCTLLAKDHDVEVVSFHRLYPRFLFARPTQPETNEKKPYKIHTILDTLDPTTWEHAAQYICDRAPDRVLFHWWTTFTMPAYLYLAWRLKGKVKMGALVHNLYPHGGGLS